MKRYHTQVIESITPGSDRRVSYLCFILLKRYINSKQKVKGRMMIIRNKYHIFLKESDFIQCKFEDIKEGGVFQIVGKSNLLQKISESGYVSGSYELIETETNVMSTLDNIKSENMIRLGNTRIEYSELIK
jgi:hypothetical protein